MKPSWINLMAIVLLLNCSACVSTIPALYVEKDFNRLDIDQIHLLPTLDLRIDSTKKLKIDQWVHQVLKKNLVRKKYQIISHRERKLIATISEESLSEEKPSWLEGVSIEKARWVLLPVLHDVSTKSTFGSTGNAEMSAMLFDLERYELIWKHKTASQVGQGGLLGLAMKGTMAQEAIRMASLQLAAAFPKH